jgi:hypothetical protein
LHEQFFEALEPNGEFLLLSWQLSHASAETCPSDDLNFPAAQWEQDALPDVLLKNPAGHATQSDPSKPVKPGSQRHILSEFAPAELVLLPEGHSRQAAERSV